MAFLSLLVLENPWESDVADRLSVVPFVEGFVHWARDMETFVRPFFRKDELRLWLEDFGRRRRGISRRLVYVASHGNRKRLGGLPTPTGRGSINFSTFTRVVREVGRIEGIHLGCCYIGNPSNAERLLRPDNRRRRAVPCR